jgi:hypothetical protein
MLMLFVVIFLAIVAALAYRSYRPAPQLLLNAKWRLSRAFLLGFVPSVIVFIGVKTVDGWRNVSHTFHESPFTALGMFTVVLFSLPLLFTVIAILHNLFLKQDHPVDLVGARRPR